MKNMFVCAYRGSFRLGLAAIPESRHLCVQSWARRPLASKKYKFIEVCNLYHINIFRRATRRSDILNITLINKSTIRFVYLPDIDTLVNQNINDSSRSTAKLNFSQSDK